MQLEVDLFGDVITEKNNNDLEVIPVSVIDVSAQKKRSNEDHNAHSSRKNFSPFTEEIADLCYQFYLRDAEIVVDPFAGWGERHMKADQWGKKYHGFDISPDAIRKAFEDYGILNTLADSSSCEIPRHQGMLTCPPYWNLEKYASESGADRERTWGGFKQKLHNILKRFYDAGEPGAIFCIMVGDWRSNHKYYDLENAVANMYFNFGAEIVDKVIVSRKKISKIKIMLPQAKRLGYSVKVHEYLSVFKKPELKGV